MKLDAIQVEVRNIILAFKGSPTAVEIVAEKEAEIDVLNKSKNENQAKLATLSFAQSPEDRRIAMVSLIDKMRSETNPQRLHDTRTELNLRLREAIKQVVFDRTARSPSSCTVKPPTTNWRRTRMARLLACGWSMVRRSQLQAAIYAATGSMSSS